MDVRSVRVRPLRARSRRVRPLSSRSLLVRSGALVAGLVLVLVLVLAGCAGESTPTPPAAPAISDTAVSATAPATTPAGATTGPAGRTGTLPTACALVPAGAISAATGLRFADPAPTEGERRSVCAYPATATTPGLSVGVEAAARFDAKAEASRRSLGVPGTAVTGLGEQALFLYSDADLPEGVGGVLVRSGPATLDVTVQGAQGEARTREIAVAVARIALDRL